MYHSAAVVGINTTAEIESAIVGRQVYTLLAPEFRETQTGTLHFHYLRDVAGGLVHVARDVSEHLSQLDAALRDGVADEGRCRRFVESFVRPHGLAVPAASTLVDAIELAAGRPALRRTLIETVAPVLRPWLSRMAARAERRAALRLEAKAADRESRNQLARAEKKRQRRARKRREAAAPDTP
jgi:hypothetical protein